MSASRDDNSKSKMIDKCRLFEKIPIFIVEDHNDVLLFIYRCLGARRMPFKSNKIIHFDAHPDLTIPKYMPAEYIRDKERLFDSLSIENWIMPTAYAGHIDNIIWLKPQFSNQIGDGDYEFRIGDYAGNIRCDSWLEYFLSEGTYQPRSNLNNQRLINLRVFTLNERLIAVQQRTIQPVEFRNCIDNANEQYILDIDLDFFSTANPFKKILKTEIYDNVKKLFKWNFFDRKFDSNLTEDELIEFTKERSDFIDALENVFRQLEQKTEEKDLIFPDALQRNESKEQLFDLIRAIKKQNENNEISFTTIFDCGCTFDSHDLPHHISSEEEILQMVDMFKRFLKTLLYMPCIITISRSSEDDYCPSNQVDFIQEHVLKAIYDVYGDKLDPKPILHYKDEEWSV